VLLGFVLFFRLVKGLYDVSHCRAWSNPQDLRVRCGLGLDLGLGLGLGG
jgi:hypothetical protein